MNRSCPLGRTVHCNNVTMPHRNHLYILSILLHCRQTGLRVVHSPRMWSPPVQCKEETHGQQNSNQLAKVGLCISSLPTVFLVQLPSSWGGAGKAISRGPSKDSPEHLYRGMLNPCLLEAVEGVLFSQIGTIQLEILWSSTSLWSLFLNTLWQVLCIKIYVIKVRGW